MEGVCVEHKILRIGMLNNDMSSRGFLALLSVGDASGFRAFTHFAIVLQVYEADDILNPALYVANQFYE